MTSRHLIWMKTIIRFRFLHLKTAIQISCNMFKIRIKIFTHPLIKLLQERKTKVKSRVIKVQILTVKL